MGTPKRLSVTQSEMDLIRRLLECLFPNLDSQHFEPVSEETNDYNCIAWAAEDTDNWWWPLPEEDGYWPPSIPRTVEKHAFIAAFKAMGYGECGTNFDLEFGYEKVALYLDPNDKPTHMARQLSSGIWTSKLGPIWDIEHSSPSGVEGIPYGTAAVALRRPIQQS